MIIKKQKTIILVFLFLCTLFLTGKFTLGLSSVQNNPISSVQNWEYESDVKLVFKPQNYIISFGGGIYTKNAYEYNDILWENVQSKLIENISEFNFEKNLSILKRDEWQEVIQNRGVYFAFPFNASFRELCVLLDIEQNNILKDINVDGVWISVYEDKEIYLSDRKQGLFYKFSTDNYDKENLVVSDIVENIEMKEVIEYRAIEDLFSLSLLEKDSVDVAKKENITNELFPVTNKDINFIKVRPEFTMDVKYEAQFKSFVRKSFGKNFSFVKKMRDVDESIIYIYGYANKALRIGSDGSINYTQTAINKQRDVKLSFSEALTKSLHTIDMYAGVPSNLFLSEYNKINDDINREIWNFEFDYRISNLPVIQQNDISSHGVHIEIVDGQVTKFIRKIYLIDGDELSYLSQNAMTFNQVLDLNSKLIQKNYLEIKNNLRTLDDNELWVFILRDITNVDIAYKVDDKDNLLYPVWQFRLEDHEYNFPLYK